MKTWIALCIACQLQLAYGFVYTDGIRCLNTTQPTSSPVTVPECGQSRFTLRELNRIVGGKPASVAQFPWQAYLRIVTQEGEMLCGSSILNSQWILTAAHCLTSEQTGMYVAQQVEVVAGTLNRDSTDPSRQSRYADCMFKHPAWRGVNAGFRDDIALLRLPSHDPLDLNYNRGGRVNAICLPPKTTPPFDFVGTARVAGWGLTRNRGVPSRNLQYTDVSVISDRDCRRYNYPVSILDSMVCQGVDQTSPCQGDSGGPLIIRRNNRYTQIGLVSFGPGICNNGRIPNAVYTQVSHHLDWIENTVREYSGAASCVSRPIELFN